MRNGSIQNKSLTKSSIIYIVCPGHSGSTLLDMLLGMHEDVLSTGELVHLPNQYFRNNYLCPTPLNGTSCSCGKSFYDCDFWGEIITQLNLELNYNIVKYPLKFKIAFLMSQKIPHQKIIHKIKRTLLFLFIKRKLRFIDQVIALKERNRIKNNEHLFRLIKKTSGVKYVVDSTKDIYRLHYLLKSKMLIQVIVLKRNILGVSASTKKLKKNPLTSAKHWIKYYSHLDDILKYNKVNPIIIHYENLVREPLNELNRIYQYLGISQIKKFSGSFNTHKYHIVGGNGLRYRGKVTIKEDNSWKNRLTDIEKGNIVTIANKAKIKTLDST